MVRFRNREEAGRRLAAELWDYAHRRPLILALPRGGVPVAYEIAHALLAPLDVWVVRKIGVPWHPELGIGAVAEGGYVHLSEDIMRRTGLSEEEILSATNKARRELEERVRQFRGPHPRPTLEGRTVMLVDDGVATGGTVRAAVRSVREQNPAEIVLAIPVAPPEVLSSLSQEVDRTVCLHTPSQLYAVGQWYQDFGQVPDQEVVHLLKQARKELTAGSLWGDRPSV